MKHVARLLSVLAVVICVGCVSGCVSPVTFTAPCQVIAANKSGSCMASGPATQATLIFGTNFDPSNSLNLTYDGQNVTANLTPAPAPGGSSSLSIPPSPPSYYTGGGSHTMVVNDTCGFFCVYPSVTMTFTPGTISIFAPSPQANMPVVGSLATPTQATFISLTNGPVPSGTVSVTLSASPQIVWFESSPGVTGQKSITVPISAGSNEAMFYVQGMPGETIGKPFTVTAIAAGYQLGMQAGSIQATSPQ
jgi:hypothetical protein